MDLSHFFTIQNFIRLIDILIVWFVMYKIWNFVSGTRAMQLVRGVFILVIVRVISWWMGLNTVSWVLDQIISWGPVILLILFQEEIKSAIEQLGNGFSLFTNKNEKSTEFKVIDSLEQALIYLSKKKIGALIAIEQQTSLQEIINTGIKIDADISSALLINTFIPNTPLHDGAVIIRDQKIVAATAYLPNSQNDKISKDLGTRHRAALGLSEVTDALVMVVSEETGEVSIAYRGYLNRNMKPEEYDDFLRSKLFPIYEEHGAANNNWFTKITKGDKK
ncbi:MAG: diadenylate cyclase CdaA [Lactobacillaceae bacterium]|jgi:diadenylate cyclase|nr:diadenylate cyclase CdaA [Lactobacillaceae bacterium]